MRGDLRLAFNQQFAVRLREFQNDEPRSNRNRVMAQPRGRQHPQQKGFERLFRLESGSSRTSLKLSRTGEA